jgi:hypothetical protein
MRIMLWRAPARPRRVARPLTCGHCCSNQRCMLPQCFAVPSPPAQPCRMAHVACRMLWLHWDRWPMALSCSRSMRCRTRACRTPSASRCRCPSRPGCSPTAGPTTATGALGHTAAVASLVLHSAVHGSTHVSKGPCGPLGAALPELLSTQQDVLRCVATGCTTLQSRRYAVQASHSGHWWDDAFIELMATEVGRGPRTHRHARTHARARARTHERTHMRTHTPRRLTD